MATFIRCSVEQITKPGENYIYKNMLVNLDYIKYIYKYDNTYLSIYFGGIDIQWCYLPEQADLRDKDFDDIANGLYNK